MKPELTSPLSVQFSLIHGIYSYLSSKDEVKILVVGLSRAGKTTFLEAFKSLHVQGYSKPATISPTIGMNLARVPYKELDVTLWDVGGTMRGIWEQYVDEADGLVLVVDASERARFGECASTLAMLLSCREGARQPVAVLANKQDIRDAAHTDEIAENVCRAAGLPSSRREYRIFETAAVQGQGVRDAGDWILGVAKAFAAAREPSA